MTDGAPSLDREFRAVVAAGPDRPAVRSYPRSDAPSDPDGGVVSYAQLDHLATGVARLVLDLGAPAELPVLLDLEPGLLLVAAQLGVWRAGRFFVALDATAPPERNAAIVSDAGSVVALTGRPRGVRRPYGTALAVSLERTRIEIAAQPGCLPAPTLEAGAIAALTYTSGSTGRPKGVVQTHGSVLRNVRLTCEALGVGPGDRMPLLYPSSVNPALRELLTALLSGAELLPFQVTSEGVAGLGIWLRSSEATVYSSGVTLFRQLAALTPEGEGFPGVRKVKLGGEPVGAHEITLFRRLFSPPARLYFGLGTTETGTVTTCFFDHDTPLPAAVPLGRPAPGLDLAVVDDEGSPLPHGEIGELAVTGLDLGAGYWRDPEATARAFAPVPGRTGVVTHRTGDRVRRTPEGTFEHHGRAGGPVKIRGLRFELAEVEAALVAVPGVAAAAVALESGDGLDGRLAAFVVPSLGTAGPERSQLRRVLGERLPVAMVPERFIVVAALPLTPNGKLDRHSLAGLEGRELPAERQLTYPRDPIETRLAALWCEVLGLEIVGIDESFFDLGGDSAKAVELFRQIERRFGEALPVALVFEAPTVRLQASRLRDGLARGALAPLITLGGGGAGPALFCIPAVDGYAFVYRPLAAELHGERALEVFQFPGLDGTAEPLGSVEELAQELIRRMRAHQPAGPYHLLGHSYGGLVAYEMARQLAAAGERVAFLGLCDSHTPDAERLLARLVRDAELLALGTRRVWREGGWRGLGRLVGTARTLAHMALGGYRRRLRGSLVEHTIHRVRQVSLSARQRYRFGAPLALPGTRVLLLRATPPPGTARRWTRLVERANGWAPHFADKLEIRDVPGDHIQMLNPPHVAVLAAELRSALAKTSSSLATPSEP